MEFSEEELKSGKHLKEGMIVKNVHNNGRHSTPDCRVLKVDQVTGMTWVHRFGGDGRELSVPSENLREATVEDHNDQRVFYTYTWGSAAGSARGYPMTFTGRGPRTMAIRRSRPGDLVFGIVSNNPTSGAPIDPKLAGRVACVWQVTHLTADTADFGITAQSDWDKTEDGDYRWPYALKAMRIWGIDDPPLFRELGGYSNTTHHMDAVTTIREIAN